MKKVFDPIDWRINAPATPAQIEELQVWFGQKIPDDFQALLFQSNGGEGPVGMMDLRILGTGEIPPFDTDYEISKRLGIRILPVGTDGGDICLIYDLRDLTRPCVLSVPLGALDFCEAKYLGDSLEFVIDAIACGAITNEDF